MKDSPIDEIIALLQLEPHIEGGWFKEVYRHPAVIEGAVMGSVDEGGNRNLATSIYFLLRSGQKSRLHRLVSDEIWFFHAGDPLLIHTINQAGDYSGHLLGAAVHECQLPQILIPAGTVFGAETIGEESFTLMSCVVTPGFDYRDFTLFTVDELLLQFPQHQEMILRMNE
jgi:uncharacterized protein